MDGKELMTMLLAEDDDGHALLIRRQIEDLGLRNPVIRFKNGVEAWDFMSRQSEPCLEPAKSYLLLLDIRMPGMDGIEILRRVKEDPCLKSMPVIIVTTSSDPKDIIRCYDLGCSSYIIKPLEPEKFSEALKRLGLFLPDEQRRQS